MPSFKLDVWDWLALALLLGCAVHAGVLVFLLHYRPDVFHLVLARVDALPFSPNRLLPFAYTPRELAPPGYLVTRQVNILLVPLVAYYLVFRIRADFTGREPISGLDLLFGIVSIPLLPLLIVAAGYAPETSAAAPLGGRILGSLHGFTSRNSLGGLAYLAGCLALANGVSYLPAYAASRLLRRVRRWLRARSRRGEDSQGYAAVARARWLSDIQRDPNASKLIRDAADAAIVEASATDLLHALVVTSGASAGLVSAGFEEWSEHSRLRAKTTGTWRVEAPYGHVVLAFLGAIAEQNIEPVRVNEARPGREIGFAARVPSSPSSWKGVLSCELEGSGWSYRVDATVVFPGQLFAWGRGRRILSKLRRDMAEYVAELGQRRV